MTRFIYILAFALSACSLFQPAAVAPVAPNPQQVAQVAQKVIACITQSAQPCLTQPPPLNNPQLCLALASSTCAAVN
jgi:hypothetical protein